MPFHLFASHPCETPGREGNRSAQTTAAMADWPRQTSLACLLHRIAGLLANEFCVLAALQRPARNDVMAVEHILRSLPVQPVHDGDRSLAEAAGVDWHYHRVIPPVATASSSARCCATTAARCCCGPATACRASLVDQGRQAPDGANECH